MGKKNTNKQSKFVPLTHLWRKKYQNLMTYLNDNSEKNHRVYEESEARWVKSVNTAAKNNRINALINNQPFANQKEKSFCVRDAINVCGEHDQMRVWGVSVTGSVGQLLAVARSANAFAQTLSQMCNSPVAFVGAIPAHIASVISPQAMADIVSFAPKLFGDDAHAAQQDLSKQLEPYLFQTHCDLEKMASGAEDLMGTMVLTFVSRGMDTPMFVGRYTSEQSKQWARFIEEWKAESENVRVFFTNPEQWTRSLVLGLTTLVDFTWAMNARVDNKVDKVLDVNRVWVDYQDNQIVVDAFTANGFFGSASLPVETTLWPFHMLVGNWEERDIVVLQKEKE